MQYVYLSCVAQSAQILTTRKRKSKDWQTNQAQQQFTTQCVQDFFFFADFFFADFFFIDFFFAVFFFYAELL